MAPASAFVMVEQQDGSPTSVTAFAEPVSAEMAQAQDAVAAAWRDRTVHRERTRVAAQYARRFRIPADLALDIHWAATKEHIDPHLAFKLVRVESSFRSTAVSPVGAVGLTQVMPATADWLIPGTSAEDLMEARFNLRVGFRYLRKLLDTYGGNAHLALLAYNRGPGVVDALLDQGFDPDNGYGEFVLTGDGTRHQEFIKAKAAAVDGSGATDIARRGKS
ncbi:MAG: lytic transglycosylase domain-containing protein [Longimicrobiales bacterium]